MKVFLAPSFVKAYKKLIKRNHRFSTKIKEQIELFKENPASPALKLHKLKGVLGESWSFSVTDDLRIIISYCPDGAVLVDIGTHEEVY